MTDSQLSNCVTMVNLKTSEDEPTWLLEPKKFSSWKRLTLPYAWVMRFLNNSCASGNQKVLKEN